MPELDVVYRNCRNNKAVKQTRVSSVDPVQLARQAPANADAFYVACHMYYIDATQIYEDEAREAAAAGGYSLSRGSRRFVRTRLGHICELEDNGRLVSTK